MTKTLIEKLFEDTKATDTLEISILTPYLQLNLGYSPSYGIYIVNGLSESPRVRFDVRKNKILGYNINRGLGDQSGKTRYQWVNFSFTKNNASKKAHSYALEIAQKISEKYGIRLIDKSQEDLERMFTKLRELQDRRITDEELKEGLGELYIGY